MVVRSAGIAGGAIAKAKALELITDQSVITALERIANIESAIGDQDRNGRQLSWKDMASITIDAARQTLEKVEPIALTLQQARNAIERPGLQHDQGMEW